MKNSDDFFLCRTEHLLVKRTPLWGFLQEGAQNPNYLLSHFDQLALSDATRVNLQKKQG